MSDLVYSRMLVKLSGEALMGSGDFGIDPAVIERLAGDLAALRKAGVETGVVIGGGNLFRGAGLAAGGQDRVTGDHMGMLATVMNSLAMRDALRRLGVPARVMSALSMPAVCDDYSVRAARRALAGGEILLLSAGTGNPYFTTDSAASLRAIEIQADVLIKATNVDGVYSADPKKDPRARFYAELTYDQAIAENLGVMDMTAIVLCREQRMPLRVMSIAEPNALLRVARGESIGSVVTQ